MPRTPAAAEQEINELGAHLGTDRGPGGRVAPDHPADRAGDGAQHPEFRRIPASTAADQVGDLSTTGVWSGNAETVRARLIELGVAAERLVMAHGEAMLETDETRNRGASSSTQSSAARPDRFEGSFEPGDAATRRWLFFARISERSSFASGLRGSPT
ncbi:MAG: hypothetical protein H6708_19840 [Kofleriaceae bacterium]|nr:hypothetical protein [Kofleriaceae bacterium]